MIVKVKYHNKNIDKIQKTVKGDWIDLRIAETVQLKAGEHKVVSLGISMQLPSGYEAWVAPRSSAFKNWGVLQTNTPAIFDQSFCGDNDIWKWSIYATRDTIINENDRVCQFRIIQNMPSNSYPEVEFLTNEDRQGIGSSGIN